MKIASALRRPHRDAALAGIVLLLIAAAIVWRYVFAEEKCAARLSGLEAALAASNDAMARAPSAAPSERCGIYRRRAALLSDMASAQSMCTSPLLVKSQLWRSVDAEQRAVEVLAAQSCPSAKRNDP